MGTAIADNARDYFGIGTCQSGGTLSGLSGGRYHGRAFDLLKLPEIRSSHARLTAGQYPWVRLLDGPSDENRLFTKDAQSLVVFSSCKPQWCADARLYGAIDPKSKSYGFVVTEDRRERVFGHISPLGREGIACAREMDGEVAKRTSEQTLKQVK
jgi:hypothetical protein